MNIGDRIKKAREAAGLSQEQLADLLNVKQQAVQQWESGETQRPKKINELAAILGVSIEYLLNGQENLVDFPYPLVPRCPLIRWEDAKEWPANKVNLKNDKKLDYPGAQIILNGNCYMLQIEDNSMIDNMEAKGFYKGKLIIVDPRKKFENESFVIAKKKDLSKPLFRQYINDGKNEYLNPLNISKYKQIDMSPDIEICGVVVAYLDVLI